MFQSFKWGMAYVCPRGVGPTEWTGSPKAQTHRLRRFYLVGQTADGMRVWDIRRGIQALRLVPGLADKALWLQGHREAAVNALYASLFEESVTRLDLHDMPASHANGPHYLNVLRYLDIPQATSMALERSKVVLYSPDTAAWDYVADTSKALGLPEKQWQIRKPVEAGE